MSSFRAASREPAAATPDSSRLGYTTSATSPDDSGCQSDFAMADIHMMEAQVTGSLQHPVPQSDSNEEPLRSAVHTWISDNQLSIGGQPHPVQSHSMGGPNMSAAVFNGEANSTHAPIPTPSHPPGRHPVVDCYTSILAQTAKLMQAQAQTGLPPGIDLVFEAERDFSIMRQRLLTCTGHSVPSQQHGNGDPNLIALESTNSRHRPCLTLDRPVLLSLALLAEHVIGMLEDMFRLAAQAAHTIDKTNLGLSWSGSGPGTGAQEGVPVGPLARRLQRSCRSLWAKPCVSPLVEASRDLRLGDFMIDNPAKSNAMRRILSLRVDRMLQALLDMRRCSWGGQRDGSQMPETPLDWGGSASLMSEIAGTLVDDLIRRVESLQGAMVLIRNDSMI
ncbi:hypothetical protein SCUP515_05663 [Seiridium cupressi]